MLVLGRLLVMIRVRCVGPSNLYPLMCLICMRDCGTHPSFLHCPMAHLTPAMVFTTWILGECSMCPLAVEELDLSNFLDCMAVCMLCYSLVFMDKSAKIFCDQYMPFPALWDRVYICIFQLYGIECVYMLFLLYGIVCVSLHFCGLWWWKLLGNFYIISCLDWLLFSIEDFVFCSPPFILYYYLLNSPSHPYLLNSPSHP